MCPPTRKALLGRKQVLPLLLRAHMPLLLLGRHPNPLVPLKRWVLRLAPIVPAYESSEMCPPYDPERHYSVGSLGVSGSEPPSTRSIRLPGGLESPSSGNPASTSS